MQPWEVMPWYGMVFGPIMMIIWLVIVIAVVVIRWVQGGAGPSFPFAGGGNGLWISSKSASPEARSTKMSLKRKSVCFPTD